MAAPMKNRAHVITGGFPPGAAAGHDHDYARLQLLGMLSEHEVPADHVYGGAGRGYTAGDRDPALD